MKKSSAEKKTENHFQSLKDYAFFLLSRRPQSIKELSTKLYKYSIKKKVSDQVVKRVINDLISNNFLDDDEFTLWWIKQRCQFRPKGRAGLIYELGAKGINRQTIDQAINKIFSEEQDEFSVAKNLITKKIKNYQKLPKEELRKKVTGLLQRRGFNWQITCQVIDSLLDKEYNMTDEKKTKENLGIS